jgi:mannose-6-phosphate isomerase-like protein (cupin superfamily)
MTRSIEVVRLRDELARVTEPWNPAVIAEVSGHHVKVVKLEGEFVWHRHAREDELFLVLHGTLTMRLRDRDLTVKPGEFVVIPSGVDHCPVASEEVHVLLFEPAAIRRTGDPAGDRDEEAPQP